MHLRLQVGIRNVRGQEWFAGISAAGLALFLVAVHAGAQTVKPRLLDEIADQIAAQNQVEEAPNLPARRRWGREAAIRLEAMSAAWYDTANGEYYRYLQQTVDAYLKAGQSAGVETEGSDGAAMGSSALLLYRVTLHKPYYEAARRLRDVAAAQCGADDRGSQAAAGNSENEVGGCLDAPFLAEYALVFQQPGAFASIARALERWDQDDAGAKAAGLAERRSLAWEAKSVVDALPYFPEDGPERTDLAEILRRIAAKFAGTSALAAAKEAQTKPEIHRDNRASVADCLLVYAVLKGVRLGYLPERDEVWADREWQKIERAETESGGGKIDGRAGALLLAASEADLAGTAAIARGKTVLLDAWFNSQKQQNAAGQTEYFHYKWFDMSNSGYSLLGHMFRGFGMKTETLYNAPTRENLRGASYYIIVSPDIPVKNPEPHYMTEKDAAEVAAWVKQGGILILMENDPPNADIQHLNLLADTFGIHFDDVLHHHILGEKVEAGTIPVRVGGPVFRSPHTLYMKDTCAISLSGSAAAVLRDRGDVVMATARYGRGRVFAAVDPWLYNEYTDGRRNPKIYGGFDNFSGGMELAHWLAELSSGTSKPTTTGQKEQP